MTTPGNFGITFAQLENAGGLENAIDRDAENVFRAFPDDEAWIGRLFQRITEKGEGEKPIRKPETLPVLEKICGLSAPRLREIVDAFAARDLLVLRPLESGETQVDLPHECLGWKWKRLARWIDDEAALAKSLQFLNDSAKKKQWLTGSALVEAQQLRDEGRLEGPWPRRYLSEADTAVVLRWVAESAKRERAERRRRMWAASAAGAAAVVFGALAVMFYQERAAAQRNLITAEDAVNALAGSGSGSSEPASEARAVVGFRHGLLTRADEWNLQFAREDPNFAKELPALKDLHAADSGRLKNQNHNAVPEYTKAIDEFTALAKEFPKVAEYQEQRAETYNWRGECERLLGDYPSAVADYTKSQEVLNDLLRDTHAADKKDQYELALARSLYNRGIAHRAENQRDLARADDREAVELLKRLAGRNSAPQYRQGLARAENTLAPLEASKDHGELLTDAIRLGEGLHSEFPDSYEYQLELAKYHSNLAIFLETVPDYARAKRENTRSLELLEDLAAPQPSLDVEVAHAYIIKGEILEASKDFTGAGTQYTRAIERFKNIENSQELSNYNAWYGDALADAAYLLRNSNPQEAIRLFREAAERHEAAGNSNSRTWDLDQLKSLSSSKHEK